MDRIRQLRRNAPHLNTENTSRRQRFLLQILLFALLHYVALLSVSGLVFFACHTPPKAVNLDALVNALVVIENVLVAP